jgi:hypothetical protein
MSCQTTITYFKTIRDNHLPSSPPAKCTDTKATPNRLTFSGRGRGGGRDPSLNPFHVLQEFDKDIDQQEALPTMGNPPQVAPEALATLKSSQSILDDNGTSKEAPALETTPVLCRFS